MQVSGVKVRKSVGWASPESEKEIPPGAELAAVASAPSLGAVSPEHAVRSPASASPAASPQKWTPTTAQVTLKERREMLRRAQQVLSPELQSAQDYQQAWTAAQGKPSLPDIQRLPATHYREASTEQWPVYAERQLIPKTRTELVHAILSRPPTPPLPLVEQFDGVANGVMWINKLSGKPLLTLPSAVQLPGANLRRWSKSVITPSGKLHTGPYSLPPTRQSLPSSAKTSPKGERSSSSSSGPERGPRDLPQRRGHSSGWSSGWDSGRAEHAPPDTKEAPLQRRVTSLLAAAKFAKPVKRKRAKKKDEGRGVWGDEAEKAEAAEAGQGSSWSKKALRKKQLDMQAAAEAERLRALELATAAREAREQERIQERIDAMQARMRQAEAQARKEEEEKRKAEAEAEQRRVAAEAEAARQAEAAREEERRRAEEAAAQAAREAAWQKAQAEAAQAEWWKAEVARLANNLGYDADEAEKKKATAARKEREKQERARREKEKMQKLLMSSDSEDDDLSEGEQQDDLTVFRRLNRDRRMSVKPDTPPLESTSGKPQVTLSQQLTRRRSRFNPNLKPAPATPSPHKLGPDGPGKSQGWGRESSDVDGEMKELEQGTGIWAQGGQLDLQLETVAEPGDTWNRSEDHLSKDRADMDSPEGDADSSVAHSPTSKGQRKSVGFHADVKG